MKATTLLPDLFCFHDTCNVYVVRDGTEAVAVDFGSGRWLRELPRLGVRSLRHVFLTHHHADQCAGLAARKTSPFVVHAPREEERFLSPAGVAAYWRARRPREGCPPSYSVLPRGLRGVRYDMADSADLFWGRRRIRFLRTPGHSLGALSVLLTHEGKQVVFCGDAAHAGATLWQPYHLEWDHWTGAGALAAWEGVRRLADLQVDLLCPAHGLAVADRPQAMLRQLARKLMDFYRAKGNVSPGERDDYADSEPLPCGARRVLPHLFQYDNNSYLLLSETGEAMLIDPPTDPKRTAPLLAELRRPPVTAATATHFHSDHTGGLPAARRRYGAKVWLHPWVAAILHRGNHRELVSFPAETVRADRLWPARGRWRWNEYEFRIAPLPGQTWWHCGFMTRVDGQKVLFSGDNFQPASRWNGTGGFCAFNGSRLEGYARSARLVLQWRPDLLAAGHRTYFRFRASRFRKVLRWASRAKSAVQALCPTGDLENDYHLHSIARESR
ncbi:MAG TPA: hypothetical protein DCX07_12220 [Phycisphaerales bacterium]|nr:hypothetical protein [Phycisphaerales bacterium]